MNLSFIQIRRFLTACVFLTIFAFVLVIWLKSQFRQKRLLREGQPIVEAIQAFHDSKHRLPKNLKELPIPSSKIDAAWRYYSNEDGNFGIYAYIWGRACIRYDMIPVNPNRTGWFYDNETGDLVRLIPPRP